MTFLTAGLPAGIERDTSLVLLAINVFFPGVGTLIASALGSDFTWVTVAVAVAQLITSFIIVGWVWAIFWSCVLVQKARAEGDYTPILPVAGDPDTPPSAPADDPETPPPADDPETPPPAPADV